MNEDLKQVFGLVKATLRNETYFETINNPLIYKIARENGFSGMVFQSIKKELMEPSLFSGFQRDHYQYKERDVLQTMAIEELHQLFNINQIKHIFLKGSFLKTIYPESYMRSMGDIDIFVDSERMETIHEVLPIHGFAFESSGPTHDTFVNSERIHIEVHPAIDTHFDEKSHAVFKKVWEEAIPIKAYQYSFDHEHQMIYLLSHLIKHLRSSGVGLRQILDIGVFRNDVRAKIDETKLETMLELTGLKRFYQVMIWLNEVWFGYPSDMTFPTEFNDAFLEEVTTFISASGIHGKAQDFNRALPKLTNTRMKIRNRKMAKISYLLNILFLPYEDMVSMRPYLKKHKWLLPYAWIERFFQLVFKKGRRSLKKIQEVAEVNSTLLDEQASLYRRIGL
jgi:hypothetical protein